MLSKLIVMALLAGEARWRLPWLRVILVVAMLVFIELGLGLTPATRRVIASPKRVTAPAPPSQPAVLASEYVSGVLEMKRAALEDLGRVVFPLYVLAWLAISPVILEWVPRLWRALRERPEPRRPAGGVST